MITFLVGHRGVGKTSLLKRIAEYGSKKFEVYDLDEWIVREEGKSIREIWAHQGESGFRKLESEHLDRLLARAQKDAFICLGAGFEGILPNDSHCVWVRRPTDDQGRIFLDRPRLNPDISALEEYRLRYLEREPRYRKWATAQLVLPEGFHSPSNAERSFFLDELHDLGGALTILPENFNSFLEEFLQQRVRWGVRWFELRDDLLSASQIQKVAQIIPAERILLSLRHDRDKRRLLPATSWDWPVEWGACQGEEKPTIVSLHERRPRESLHQALERLEIHGAGSFLKASPIIESFAELEIGHQWAQQDLRNRAFLPRSATSEWNGGRWRWYRLLMKNRYRLNFFREGDGSSGDQPWLLEWVQNEFGTPWFAAILGNPVEHSLTPVEQGSFFEKLGLPVLRVPVTTEQWRQGALNVLERLGLRFAAVTAPLKQLAYRSCYAVEEIARQFQSANTLKWTPEGWHGTNTDVDGLRLVLKNVDSRDVAVWGGGGTLGPLIATLPDAHFYSARLGQDRNENVPDPTWTPEVVVWAVGESHMKECAWPPADWQPWRVIDLNYTENSPGREYALKTGAQYTSGHGMFLAQATEQRKFWSQL